jgi:hypothetical protein
VPGPPCSSTTVGRSRISGPSGTSAGPSTSNPSRVPFTFTCMRPSDLHASLCGRAKNSAQHACSQRASRARAERAAASGRIVRNRSMVAARPTAVFTAVTPTCMLTENDTAAAVEMTPWRA